MKTRLSYSVEENSTGKASVGGLRLLMAATLMSMVCSGCADKKGNPSGTQTRNTLQTLNNKALPEQEIAQLLPGLNQELSEEIKKKGKVFYDDLGIKIAEIYNSQDLPHFKKLNSLLSGHDIYFVVYMENSDNSINLFFQREDGQFIMVNGEPFMIKAIIPITPNPI